MLNELKLEQVTNAINANNLSAFDDESLAKLLSILNPAELDVFELDAYTKLGGASSYERIRRVRPIIEYNQRKEIRSFKNSELFHKYITSLENGNYLNFFKESSVEELARLKNYCIMTVKDNKDSISATNKVVRLITREISHKEANKNLTFS